MAIKLHKGMKLDVQTPFGQMGVVLKNPARAGCLRGWRVQFSDKSGYAFVRRENLRLAGRKI